MKTLSGQSSYILVVNIAAKCALNLQIDFMNLENLNTCNHQEKISAHFACMGLFIVTRTFFTLRILLCVVNIYV
jgi:glutathione peroxidase-family protein